MPRLKPFAVLALAAAIALSACSKSSTHEAAQNRSAAVLARNPASASDGAAVYTTNCSSCHQTDGRGIAGAFPPLANNAFVRGNADAVIRIVKYGQSGKLAVEGVAYDGTMPRWSQLISDREIAAVVTYIRTSWSNHANAVSLAEVRSVMNQP